MSNKFLSVLKNAAPECITYYVGTNVEHVEHLQNCTLICNKEFHVNLENVELIKVDNPQLEFYKISAQYKEDYLPSEELVFSEKYRSYIHQDAKIHPTVKIGPGCTIGNVEISENVEIHANITIYNKTVIKRNTIIESNSVIGSTGVMWVWDNDVKVYLEQLGNVVIEEDCRIGSLVEIVRGSANETTFVDTGACIAHGTLIGHGCYIGQHCHFANGIKLGGNAYINNYNFLGCGVTISPGVKLLATDIIIGAGSTVTKNIEQPGVYVGIPAKWLKDSVGKLSGIPTWRK